jgi:hypothetical protein
MCFPPRDDDADNSHFPAPEQEMMPMTPDEKRAERANVLHIHTRLNVAVARRDTKLVIALMQELARLTGRPMPEGYER